ncbi:MAG: sigma-70 family RNA polymerase sigma factor [Myxococcaceae bacterium]
MALRSLKNVAFPATDERLLEALKAKRPGTWLQFYDQFAPYVLGVLRKVMGPDRELEDLVQDIFARALEGIERVREADKLKPWLRGLTVFTARETLRRRKWRSWLPLGNPEEEEDVIPFPTTTDALEERLLLRKVKAVLDSMNVDDRLAFTLRHLEGLELTEVAETLKMSLSTAKRRIWRAEEEFRRACERDRDLRACFEEEDDAPEESLTAEVQTAPGVDPFSGKPDTTAQVHVLEVRR